MDVTLGGLTFVGGAGAATYTIDSDGLKGWLDGVQSRRESAPRPVGHGEFETPTFLGGRLVTLSGLVLASSDAGFEAAIADLTGLLADGSAAEMSVAQASGTLTATVRRAGAPDIQVLVYGETARYQVQLWAADPRRYGADQATVGPGASLSVAHDGNFPASPVVTVDGPVSAPYSVASQGHTVTVTQSLAGGETHTIDMATGWVYLDGDLQSGVTSAVDVFTIPPGAGVTVTGPSTMTVDVTDTYI
jgi:hypothetical protein